MGIRIFTGTDRIKAQTEIKRVLGEGYEVFEGEELDNESLGNIFLGATLFNVGQRKVLIKDIGENKEVLGELVRRINEFVKTEAEVIIWEGKLDKRSVAFKTLKKLGIEIREYEQAAAIDMREVFKIYDFAMRDGQKAVEELERIEEKEDPYMFFGLMVSQALKRLEQRPNGRKEKRVLLELSKADVLMKTTSLEPWLIVKGLLRRFSTL